MGLAEIGLVLSLAALFLLASSAFFEFRKPLLNVAPYLATILSGIAYYFADGFDDAVIVGIISLILVSVIHLLLYYEQRKERRKK